MKEIKVLGAGCSKCKTVMNIVKETAKAHNFDGSIEKIEDIAEIVSYGVISVPAVIIDGKVVCASSVPSKEQVENWFNKTEY